MRAVAKAFGTGLRHSLPLQPLRGSLAFYGATRESNFDLPSVRTTLQALIVLFLTILVLEVGGWVFQVLKPRDGAIVVRTTPAGATIFVDGKQKGLSPITIDGLSSGTHMIRAIMPGYRGVMLEIQVLPSFKENLDWHLQPALPLLRSRELASLQCFPSTRS